MTIGIRETIARVIEPYAWGQFDNAIRPYAEDRGARLEENFWYILTWKYGCRSVEDVRAWFLDKPLSADQPTHVFLARESLTKADTILALLATP